MFIEAFVDGEIGNYIFDTGCDGVVLNATPQEKTIRLSSTSGISTFGETTITLLQVDSYEVSSVKAYVGDLSHLEKAYKRKISGIIGSSVLTTDIIHINKVEKTIDLYPIQMVHQLASGKYNVQNLISIDGLPAIAITLDDEEYHFVLDSGSSRSLINTKVLTADNFNLLQAGTINVLGAGSSTSQCQTALLDAFVIASIKVSELPVLCKDLSHLSSHPQFGGVLSLDQFPFEEIILDLPNNKLFIKS